MKEGLFRFITELEWSEEVAHLRHLYEDYPSPEECFYVSDGRVFAKVDLPDRMTLLESTDSLAKSLRSSDEGANCKLVHLTLEGKEESLFFFFLAIF